MLLASEQQYIQESIENSCDEDRNEMKHEAERILLHIGSLWNTKAFSNSELKSVELAIEILVRLECRELGKGWWFRAKRRLQIKQMYIG